MNSSHSPGPSTPRPAPPPPSFAIRRVLLGLVLPALAAGVVTTYMHRLNHGVGGNLHDSLPVVWKCQDPGLFTRDPFVDASQRQPTLFWPLLAWVIPKGSEAGGLFTWGPVVVFFLFTLGLGLLAMGFSDNPWAWASALVTGLGLGDALIGSNYLLTNQFTPTVIVVPPLLVALALGARGWAIPALGVAGLAANVHALNAAYAGAMLVGGLAVAARTRRDWIRLGFGLALAVVLAAPSLVLALRHAEGTFDRSPWSAFLHDSHPIHFHPLRQPLFIQAKTLGVILLLGSVIQGLRRLDPMRGRFLLGAGATCVGGFLVLGSVAADALELPSAIRLQPLRAAAWLMPLTVVGLSTLVFAPRRSESASGEPALGSAAAETAGDSPEALPVVRYAWLAGLGVLLGLNLLRPYESLLGMVFTVLLLGAGVLSLWPQRIGGVPARAASALAGSLAAFLPLYVGFTVFCVSVLDRYPGLAVFAHGEVIALLFLVAAWLMDRRLARDRIRPSEATRRSTADRVPQMVLLGAMVLGSLAAATFARLRTDGPYWRDPPGDGAWEEMCRWVRDHTPKDALLQGPPGLSGLRTLGRRHVFVELNDDGAVFLAPAFLPILLERLDVVRAPVVKLYYVTPPWDPSAVDWEFLRDRYGITHVVLPQGARAPGRMLHENAGYRVFALGERGK